MILINKNEYEEKYYKCNDSLCSYNNNGVCSQNKIEMIYYTNNPICFTRETEDKNLKNINLKNSN